MQCEVRTGCDLVAHERMERLLKIPDSVAGVFNPSELGYKRTSKIAGIFALKESTIKALDLTTDNWLDIEITYSDTGRPIIKLSKHIRPDNLVSIDGSVSHEDRLSIGSVVVLMQQPKAKS